MENSKVVAKVLYNMYQDRFRCPMDEMKMHKLMYFAQRESLMYDKEPLFEESFYGWKYGPVLKSVRSQFMTPQPYADVREDVSSETKNYYPRYENVMVLFLHGNLVACHMMNYLGNGHVRD